MVPGYDAETSKKNFNENRERISQEFRVNSVFARSSILTNSCGGGGGGVCAM